MKKTDLITLEHVQEVIRERPEDIHKGKCGRVLVIAGSRGMAGAAVLAAGGALRSGAGLVTAAVPGELFDIVQTAVPQATCIDIEEGFDQHPLGVFGAVAAGPGIGRTRDNCSMLKQIAGAYEGVLVLDADGLNSLCAYDSGLEAVRNRKMPTVITPHPGEADRILAALGKPGIKTLGRIEAAVMIGELLDVTVLLKGSGTIVTDGGRDIYVNTTGNPGMATGGSGDVLTGTAAAIAASGVTAPYAARCAAFIHGLAGDIAAERYGQWGMTSLEIRDSLPEAFRRVVGR